MPASGITRKNPSVLQVRAEAARTADAKQARRILAIAMGLDGHSRRLAAEACGMDRQTLRGWVHRYNADGLAGLADRPRPSRRPRLAEAQRSEVAKWVEDGDGKDGFDPCLIVAAPYPGTEQEGRQSYAVCKDLDRRWAEKRLPVGLLK